MNLGHQGFSHAPILGRTKIAEILVGRDTNAGVASVSFTNIPQNFRHLIVYIDGRGDAAAGNVQCNVQFNGDTASNYTYFMTNSLSSGGTASSGSATSAVCFWLTGATGTAGSSGGGILTIPNYTGTSFWKQIWNNAGYVSAGAASVYEAHAAWKSTAPITSMTLAPSSGNFVTGTLFSLYGEP